MVKIFKLLIFELRRLFDESKSFSKLIFMKVEFNLLISIGF